VAVLLEAVPNFSEGRDRATIEAVGAALAREARLLDVHSDVDHNRSVFTICGDAAQLTRALVAGVRCARERIDIRRHEGVHPRVGAADVVPVVGLRPEQMEAAGACAVEVARAIGEEVELQRRIDAGELAPDFGPQRLDPAAGGVLVGARRPLIAFNVNLLTDDVEVARAIAAVIRESGGGFPGLRALGLALPSRGLVQVSMNVEEPDRVALHEVVARIRAEAAERRVEAGESELVGLLPAAVAAAAARDALGVPGLDGSRLLEVRLLEA
jgi:glutamate formiminotransferase